VVGFYQTHGTWLLSDEFAKNSIAASAAGCPAGFVPAVYSMQAALQRLCTEREGLNSMDGDLTQQLDAQQKEADVLKEKLRVSQEAKKKAETAKKDMDFYKDNLEFLALKNECFTMNDGKYTYSMCVLGDVTQQELGGGNKVTLGKFDAIDEGRTEKGEHFLTIRHHKGQHCHVHGARKAEVSVTCAAEHALLSASEPAICSYALDFESPLACTPEFAKINGLV
jgi:protein kinase C substrate 80K-H